MEDSISQSHRDKRITAPNVEVQKQIAADVGLLRLDGRVKSGVEVDVVAERNTTALDALAG